MGRISFTTFSKFTFSFFLKLPFCCTPLVPTLRRLFPSASILFVTRQPRASVTSFFRIFCTLPRFYIWSRAGSKFWFQHLVSLGIFPQKRFKTHLKKVQPLFSRYSPLITTTKRTRASSGNSSGGSTSP